MEEIINPASTLLPADTDGTYLFHYSGANVSDRHEGGINVLWADRIVSHLPDSKKALDGSSESRAKYLDRRTP